MTRFDLYTSEFVNWKKQETEIALALLSLFYDKRLNLQPAGQKCKKKKI